MGYRVTIREGWNGQERLLQTAASDELRLSGDPTVSLDTEAIPSFTFELSPGHPEYSNINTLTSFVKVYKPSGVTLFEGRVLKPEESMSSSGEVGKSVTCEGLLAFLHDSYQNWGEYHDMTPRDFLQKLIDVHNGQVDEYKKMTLGTVDVTNSTDNVYRYTDDTKDTYDVINEKLIDTFGGELQVRNVNGQLILDYMNVIGTQGKQRIKLAENMISLSRSVDSSELYSVIKPLGATIEETNTTDTTDTTDTATNKPQKHVLIDGLYVENPDLIAQIGRVVKTVSWDDVNDAAILKQKATDQVMTEQFATETMEISAIDMSLIGANIDDFTCGNAYRVVNEILGVDEFKRIVKMSIHLNAPQSSTINVGDRILSQEEYNLKQRKSQQAMNNQLRNQVGYMAGSVVKASKLASSANETVANLKVMVGELQTSFDKMDVSGMEAAIKSLTGQIDDLGDLSSKVDTLDESVILLNKRVAKLETGGTKDDGSTS